MRIMKYAPNRSLARAAGVSVVFCSLIFVTVIAGRQARSRSAYNSSDHPLWRSDLRSFGFPPKDPDFQRRRNFANFNTVSFLSDRILAVTFVTRENIPSLQHRDDPNHVHPYRLHAVFLDVTTGDFLHALDWPIDDPNAGIFPRPDGGFLLVTLDRIVSYSADWTPLSELLLSQLEPSGSAIGGISESPTNRSLVIQFLRSPSSICFWVRTDALDSSQIPCGGLQVFTASDNGIAMPERLPDGNELRERMDPSRGAYIQYGASPDAVSATGGRARGQDGSGAVRTPCKLCAGIPLFISNDELVIYSASYINVVDRAGKVRFTAYLSPEVKWIDEFGRPVRASANGHRFAVATNITREHSRNSFGFSVAMHMSTLDLPAELPYDVEVYDLNAERAIYTMQINVNHLGKIWGLALSPNSNNLAIDSGGAIQVFVLPPADVHSSASQ